VYADDVTTAIAFYKAAAASSLVGLAPDIQKDLAIASGLQQYNLYPTALTLSPILTPLRNMTPRTQGLGAKAEYKAIIGASGVALSGATQVWGAEGVSGQKISLATADITSIYRALKVAGGVSFEQQWAGAQFIDSKAIEVVNTLRQLMVMEELAMLFGCNSTAAASTQFGPGAVGTLGAATLTDVAANGGGAPVAVSTLAASATSVKVSAVTGMGESLVTAATITPTATHYIRVDMPSRANQPVLYYNVYAGSSGAEKLCTSVNLNYSTAVGGGATNVSTGASVYIGSLPGSGTAFPAADTTGSTLAYNGLLPQMYASSGAGITGFGVSGSQLVGSAQPNFGSSITSALGQLAYLGAGNNALQAPLKAMWDNYKANPDWMFLSSAEGIKLATFLSGTPYFVVPDGDQNGFVVGYRASRVANPVTGKFIEARVHPNLPQGSIIFGSDQLPEWYVPSSVPAPFTVSMLQDYLEVDYPPVWNTSSGGDTWVIQVMNMGSPRLFVPVVFGALDSIVAG
jgi:hypothetical protein